MEHLDSFPNMEGECADVTQGWGTGTYLEGYIQMIQSSHCVPTKYFSESTDCQDSNYFENLGAVQQQYRWS